MRKLNRRMLGVMIHQNISDHRFVSHKCLIKETINHWIPSAAITVGVAVFQASFLAGELTACAKNNILTG